MTNKERLPRGEAHMWHKLTEEAVRDIRQRKEPVAVLARRYQVSRATIENVLKGYAWKHVT